MTTSGSRHRIGNPRVTVLGAGDKSVQELAVALPISRPAVSRHLRLLTYLEQVWGEAAARFRLVAENTER